MKCLLRYAVYAVLSIFLTGTASADPVPPQLLGTWRLVSNTLEEVASGRKTDLMGKDPIGFITYGADGRMMILQVRSIALSRNVRSRHRQKPRLFSRASWATLEHIRSAAPRSRIMSTFHGTRPGPAPIKSEPFRLKEIAQRLLPKPLQIPSTG